MELELRNKVVLVTGASAGIGRATALAFSAEGAYVMLAARRDDVLGQVVEEVAACSPGGASMSAWVKADCATHDGPAMAVDATIKRFGRLDVLVNNAAPTPMAGLLACTDDEVVEWLQGKPLGYMRAARAAIPHLRATGGGVIVNVAGLSARHATPDYFAGTMATAAIHAMTKSLADELGPSGVRVVCVDPGATDTDQLRNVGLPTFAKRHNTTIDKALEELTHHSPLGRIGQAQEVADVITFLSSARASFVTGTSLLVDGGRSRAID